MMVIVLGALSLLAFMALLLCISGVWQTRERRLDERILGGLAVFIFASNVIHLFAGLNSLIAKSAIGVLALIGLIKLLRASGLPHELRIACVSKRYLLSAALLLLFLTLLSTKSTLNYDANLYHFASIEALSSERIIIGWANLHERFAVPSSVFNVASFLGNGLWGADAYRLTGALFTCISVLAFSQSVRRVSAAQSSPGDLLTAVTVPAVWSWGLFQPYWFNGPSLDVPAALISVIAASKLADFILRRDARTFEIAAVAVVLAYSLRPVNLVLVVILLCGLAVSRLKNLTVFDVGGARLPGGLLLVLALKSTLLSGFPLAPLPLSVPGLNWALERTEIEGLSRSVRSWARKFGGTEDVGLLSVGWVPEWWANNSPALSTLVSLLAMGLLFRVLGPQDLWVKGRANVTTIVVVGAIPAAVWFVLAPALRFGWGQLAVCGASWVFAIDLSAGRRKTFDRLAAETFRTLVISAAVLLVVVPLAWGQRGVPLNEGLQLPITPVDEPLDLVGIASDNPVELRIPRVGDQCGWEIWCSPRDPASMSVSRMGLWWVVSRG